MNKARRVLLLIISVTALLQPLIIQAASCKTQAQMTGEQRDSLSSFSHLLMSEVLSGNDASLQTNSIPSLAGNFDGISILIDALKPQLVHSSITVDGLYLLDAPKDSLGAERTDFYCGAPVVGLNFNHLPPGSYALVIVHATGVPQPQQITLILSELTPGQWRLGGFFCKPMTEAGHDGLWYWNSARDFAKRNMDWNALLYYQTAAFLVDPVDFLSSPNSDKLQQEQQLIHAEGFPYTRPITLSANGAMFHVTAIDTTTTLGPLDIEVHYTPDALQSEQLNTPSLARRQVTDVMTTLLTLHPELRQAFHGIWVQADGVSSSLFSLELPMDQIVSDTGPSITSSTLSIHP